MITLYNTITLGERTKTILTHLFPVPKADSKRVVTFSNARDTITFRNHLYRMSGPDIELGNTNPFNEISQGLLGLFEERHWSRCLLFHHICV